MLEDATDLGAFRRCRGGLAIKPETAEITSDTLLLQCVSHRPDPIRPARPFSGLLANRSDSAYFVVARRR
jgi:hypothetical protein